MQHAARCAPGRKASAIQHSPLGTPRARCCRPARSSGLARAVSTVRAAAAPVVQPVAAPAVAHQSLPAPTAASFTDDRTVFVEEFRIRGNEAGPDQRANIITIANLLQEVGGNHGVAMWGRASSGFAAMPGMDHLIFVATRMQIRMEAYPSWGDLVRLETYFAEDGRLATRRDWRITNAVTGEYLGAATSTWVTINAETRKLAKIPEEVKQKFLRLAPSPPRTAIPTSETRQKLPEFVWPPQLMAPSQLGRRSDMDPNGHINNVAYLAWALEVIPDHVYQDYQLSEVEMDFKAECTAGDQIECFGMALTDCSNGNGAKQAFLHLLRKGGSDTEVWRARTTWEPKTARSRPAPADGHAASVLNGTSLAGNGKAAPRPPAAAAAAAAGPAGSAPVNGACSNGRASSNGAASSSSSSNAGGSSSSSSTSSSSSSSDSSSGAAQPAPGSSSGGTKVRTASCIREDCRKPDCSNNPKSAAAGAAPAPALAAPL